jgi:hypothetical protein
VCYVTEVDLTVRQIEPVVLSALHQLKLIVHVGVASSQYPVSGAENGWFQMSSKDARRGWTADDE